MNKLSKGFLVAFAAMAGLLFLLVLGANLYVESHGVQERLESALSRELRVPIKLAQVHFSFRGELAVSGLAIPAPEGADGDAPIPSSPGRGNFLEAPEISARIAWGPLFSRRLVIRELVISDPKVVWTQTENGKWLLPKREFESKTSGPLSSRGTVTSSGALVEASPEPATPVESAEEKPAWYPKGSHQTLEFKIEAARIENATFRFLDRAGQSVAVLEGVTVVCPEVLPNEAKGRATIRKATLHDAFVFEDLTAPVSYAGGQIKLTDFEARLAGGNVRGTYSLNPVESGAPFTLDLLVNGVELNRLLAQGGEPDAERKVAGTLQGSLDLYGQSGQKKSFGGSGQLLLRGGRMEQYSILQMIGQALQIDELTRLELQHAQLDLRVGEGKVYVDSLVMDSPNLSLSATGKTSLDGKLDLQAALSVNQKISRQLPNWVDANFQPSGSGDRRVINFKINGTLAHPQTDLLSVMVGQKIESQVLDVFRRVIKGDAHPKKKRDKKKPELQPAIVPANSQPSASPVSPTPSPSPSPGAPSLDSPPQ